MSKTKEELNELKKEVEAVNEKCRELTPEELEQVTGGVGEGLQLVITRVKECAIKEKLGTFNSGSFSSQDL